MPVYNKIVRDKIPEIIKSSGGSCDFIHHNNYWTCIYLIDKIKEESDELLKVLNLHSAVDELADLQEIIIALGKKQGYSIEDIELRRKQKLEERGGFENNVFLLKASEKPPKFERIIKEQQNDKSRGRV